MPFFSITPDIYCVEIIFRTMFMMLKMQILIPQAAHKQIYPNKIKNTVVHI